jgi:F0F1-type ATP synthase assembly protein I
MSEDRQSQGKGGTVWTEMGRYAHFGFQLALSMGLFLLGGWWLDGRIGTTPLLTIVGAMVGAAAAFYSMIRQLTSGSRSGSGKDPGRQEKER